MKSNIEPHIATREELSADISHQLEASITPQNFWENQLLSSLDDYVDTISPCFYETGFSFFCGSQNKTTQAAKCLITNLIFLLNNRNSVPDTSVFSYLNTGNQLKEIINKTMSSRNDYPIQASSEFSHYLGVIFYVSYLNYRAIWEANNQNNLQCLNPSFSCTSKKWQDPLIKILENLLRKGGVKDTAIVLQQLFITVLVDHLHYHKSEHGSYAYPQISLADIYKYKAVIPYSNFCMEQLNKTIADPSRLPKKIQKCFAQKDFDEFIRTIDSDNRNKNDNRPMCAPYQPIRRGI